MMMMTFITRRGEGQGRTKKGRKATKSEGSGLEEGASADGWGTSLVHAQGGIEIDGLTTSPSRRKGRQIDGIDDFPLTLGRIKIEGLSLPRQSLP